MKIVWHDAGREPKCPPDLNYPQGKDLHSAIGPSCRTALPYPAKRCGHFVVECELCGVRVTITTAGRPDDPRSVDIPCRLASKSAN